MHLSRAPRHRRSIGFTLAELLIVIAIIGVLISILLPTLGSARRAANSAKCLASLRDLGLAFQQYAMENKRAFPVVEYAPPAATLIAGSAPRRPWQDFLVKYIHKAGPSNPVDLNQFRYASTLWGCPSFDPELYWQNVDPGTTSFSTTYSKFNTGYGMHRWGLAPYGAGPGLIVQVNGTYPTIPGNVAMLRDTATIWGSFLKMEQWGKRAAERGLLADSNNFDLIAAATWSKSATVGTGTAEKRCDPFMGPPAATVSGSSWIGADGMRHAPPSSSQKKVFSLKGINMLFVDGHAASVTPEEAWIAVRGGGTDIRTP